MGYLFSVMWVCLAVAFVLGFLLSYFWRRARFQRMTKDSEQSWMSRIRQTEQDRDTRIARLTSELEEGRQQIPTMERSLAERSDIISVLEKTIDSNKSRIKSLEAQLVKANAAASEGVDDQAAQEAALLYSQRISELESDIEERRREAEKLGQAMEQLHVQSAAANVRAEKAEQQLEHLNKEQHKQQVLFEEHEDAATEASEKLAGSEQRVADLKQELSVVNSRNLRLQNEHGGCAAQLDAVSGKLTDMKEALKGQSDRANDLQEQLDERARDVESARLRIEQLTELQEGQRQAGQRVAELEQKVQHMQDEATQQAQNLAQAELRKTELEQTLRSRTDKLTHEEQQCLELRNRVAGLETRQAQIDEQRRSLASELANAQASVEDARGDVTDWRKQAEQLQGKLQTQEHSAGEAQQRAEHWQNEHDKIKAQLSNQSSLVDSAQRESDQLRHELTLAKNMADAARAKNIEWQQRLDNAEHATAAQARESKNRIAELEKRAALAVGQIEEAEMLRRTLKQRDTEFAREHQECNEQRELARGWRARFEALEVEQARVTAEKTPRKKRVSGKSPSGPVEKPGWLLAETPAEKDDLKKIWGVGPVLEATMNDLGIYHFRQVASLCEKDIDWLASHVNTFSGRITRDDWIGQAVKLRKEKYGR